MRGLLNCGLTMMVGGVIFVVASSDEIMLWCGIICAIVGAALFVTASVHQTGRDLRDMRDEIRGYREENDENFRKH